MDFQFRQATPDDAEAVVRMHTQAHQESYAGLLPAEFFAGRRRSMPERTEQRRPYLASPDPRLLAFDADGELVGLADAGPGRQPGWQHRLELYSLYTLQRTHGSGLGSALLQAAVGTGPAYLWTLAENHRAQAFYAKHGFIADGGRKFLSPEWLGLPEIRMVRSAD